MGKRRASETNRGEIPKSGTQLRASAADLIVAWVLVVGFVAYGYYSIMPPSVAASDTRQADFSGARAADHVAVVAAEPHPMGSEAIAEVGVYLASELEALGLDVMPQLVTAPDYYGGAGTVEVVNLVATIPGTETTGTIALMAHYDTFPTTVGANDNSAAVAAILETGRAILAGPPLRNDVILLFTDGEEPAPRYGSTAFIAENPMAGDVALVVNLEASGNSGPSMLVETGGSETWIVDQFAAAVPTPTAFSFVGATAALIGDVGTDFDPFRNAGIPGVHLAYMRGSPVYHSPADNVASVDWDSVQHHGSNALGVARHFGNLDLTTMPATGDSVYFPLRPAFIQYASGWSMVAALAAAALVGLALVRSRRAAAIAIGPLTRAAGVAAVATLTATIGATLAWLVIASLRSTPSVLESYFYLLCLFGIGAALGRWPINRSNGAGTADLFGFVLIWVALGLLTALTAPGFSYLFTLPALAAAIALNWHVGEGRASRVTRFALVAAPTLVLLTPAVDFFFQLGQPRPGNPDSNIPATASVALLLAFLAGGLLAGVWRNWVSAGDSASKAVAPLS